MTMAGEYTGPGLDVEAMMGVSLQLGRIADGMAEQKLLEQQYLQAVMSITLKPHQVTVDGSGNATILNHENDLGPASGYVWAVQRLTVAGLASGDTISFYKAPGSSAGIQATTFINSVTSTAPMWSPGRTGLILFNGDTVIAAGTSLTATTVTLTGEIIQLENWIVPQFLL